MPTAGENVRRILFSLMTNALKLCLFNRAVASILSDNREVVVVGADERARRLQHRSYNLQARLRSRQGRRGDRWSRAWLRPDPAGFDCLDDPGSGPVVWHLIVRMRPFRLVMAPKLRLFGAIFRVGRPLVRRIGRASCRERVCETG